jgi:hypothetical protein
LTILKNFLSEQRRKAGAQKRGGGQTLISLDATTKEEGYLREPVDSLTPDQPGISTIESKKFYRARR